MPLSSLCFVVAYFGQVPNYFPLFLHTAAANPTIQWKFFGDTDLSGLRLPANVTFTPMTLQEIAARAEHVFGFKPVLPGPYKLCDYKPIYGRIFAPELQRFEFWGHCDIDALLGDLRAFLTEERLQRHLRIFMTGHLSVYRNSDEGNDLFRLTAPGVDYRQVFRDPRNRYFDEWPGMYRIHLHHSIPYFHDPGLFADTWSDVADLRIGDGESAKQRQLFVWETGKVLQLTATNGRVETRELMHIHLQKRRMNVEAPWATYYAAKRWYLTGERIIPAAVEALSPADLARLNPRRPVVDWWRQLSRPVKRLKRMSRDRRLRRPDSQP